MRTLGPAQSGSGQEQVPGSCKCGNEPLSQCMKFVCLATEWLRVGTEYVSGSCLSVYKIACVEKPSLRALMTVDTWSQDKACKGS